MIKAPITVLTLMLGGCQEFEFSPGEIDDIPQVSEPYSLELVPIPGFENFTQKVKKVKYDLVELGTILPKDMGETAYYFFMNHGLSGFQLSDEAQYCAFAINKKLEELHKSGLLGSVYYEGVENGRDLNYVYEGVDDWFEFQAITDNADDQDTLYFIRHGSNVSIGNFFFAARHYDQLYFSGWEGRKDESPDFPYAEGEEIFKKLPELSENIPSTDDYENTPEFAAYEDALREIISIAENGYETRNEYAYFHPLEQANSWHREHPQNNPNYGVMVGKNHHDGIVDIIRSEDKHPRIVRYVCPDLAE
ncbi:hypothetical protein COV16_06770 [Candidatus Woesearchaeota archaeon CG10_big_fil_rev_8_21_14_0_10_34_8]|nr:MAG: hypothetical protein COV16_06770 [Candidatus Woesearchaeota archaeon CG10_big_fil_rev_8_21_14_0_10_34_8]